MVNKVIELNIEYGHPTVENALNYMKNSLVTYKRQGIRAVIIIHGYGSSGVGGSIKAAVAKCLGESSMCGIVRAFVPGENWYYRKREMLSICKDLSNYERKISGNDGITIVILK
ncbi:MAG: hypothetical protein GX285_01750 [Clostridiales bacterium]|nr:hypothetical protein [Clostridiales bacterium]